MAKDEPQSYGSEKEWVTGETGQTVNPSESGPPVRSRSTSGRTAGVVHGTSPDQSSGDGGPEVRAPLAGDAHTPVQKVTAKDRGAKRESYWKERDYKS